MAIVRPPSIFSHKSSQVVFVGGLFCGFGALLSAFATSLPWLYLTYGICIGIGNALIYIPSLTVLSHYFDAK